ncbi:MAG: patatin family protein [Clostridia bacterium]|nr:patatin family protein [Clostridia bacterium]
MGEKIGVVDVGGGYRGIYAAGVLDYCLDHGIHFDLGIGVSAGSANIASYTAGQARRNRQFYSEFGLRKEYASAGNFIRKRSYLDLDYVYGTLSNSDGESPLDYEAIMCNPAEMITVATEAETGESKYFTKADLAQNRYDIFKASSAIPVVCTPQEVDGVPYYDGALADPVPIVKAFQMGCDKVVLLLTLPQDQLRSPKKDAALARRLKHIYPKAAKALESRASTYNASVMLAKAFAQQGKLLIVAPDDTCGVSTLTKDREKLLAFYEKGYWDGVKIADFIGADVRVSV